MLILFGTWQVSQTETFRDQVQRLGNGAITLQMVGKSIVGNPAVAVQRKVETPTPVAKKVKAAPLQPSQTISSSSTTTGAVADASGYSSTAGSVYGTAKNGLTDIKSIYRTELRAMIEKNKSYPTMSKRLGQTGTVVVQFTLLEDGKITDVKIEKASRYEQLNASALEAVKKVQRFKPIPKEFGESKMEIKVPVKFITI